MTQITRQCEYCLKLTVRVLSKKITRSGAEFYGWKCQSCQRWVKGTSGGIWIQKQALLDQNIDLQSIPVVEGDPGERCSRCGNRGAEEHHWAPRAMFGHDVADLWPKDYLCKPCHDCWHRIVTPQLVKGGSNGNV